MLLQDNQLTALLPLLQLWVVLALLMAPTTNIQINCSLAYFNYTCNIILSKHSRFSLWNHSSLLSQTVSCMPGRQQTFAINMKAEHAAKDRLPPTAPLTLEREKILVLLKEISWGYLPVQSLFKNEKLQLFS